MQRNRFTSPACASVVLIFGTFLISACANSLAHTTFACEDGRSGSVTWRDDETALVSFHGDSWTLHRQPSGSGARYGDGTREIWEHQGTLTIKTGLTADAVCRFPKR